MSRYNQNIIQNFFLLVILFLSWGTPVQSAEQLSFDTKKGTLHLSELKGQVVYVDFWASWCKPCRKSFPWMNNLQERFAKQGLKVIAVNVDKDKTLVDQFLKSYPANFPIAYDPEGKLASKFGLKGMPSSFIFDRNGNLKTSHLGFRQKDIEKLESIIKEELSHKI
jgi:thiol-disulfide isomerase/thioredoxin